MIWYESLENIYRFLSRENNGWSSYTCTEDYSRTIHLRRNSFSVERMREEIYQENPRMFFERTCALKVEILLFYLPSARPQR